MRLVDSSGWLEYAGAGPLLQVYEPLLTVPAEVLSSPIVLFEVYRKLLRDRGEGEALLAAAQIQKTRVEPVTETIAVSAAELAVMHHLSMADALIYATARIFGVPLATSGAHFAGLPLVEYHPKP